MGVALDGIKPKHTGALGVVFGNYGAWASFRMIRVAAYARRVSFTLPEQVTRIAVCGISAKQRRDAHRSCTRASPFSCLLQLVKYFKARGHSRDRRGISKISDC